MKKQQCFVCKREFDEDELYTCIHCDQGWCDDCPPECDCSISVKLGVGTPEQVAMFSPLPGEALADDPELIGLLQSLITIMKPIAAAALFLLLLTLPAHAQSTTTDRQTVCTTDANDVTTCTTAPNYAEELRRAQAAERAQDAENRRYWNEINRERREGEARLQHDKK